MHLDVFTVTDITGPRKCRGTAAEAIKGMYKGKALRFDDYEDIFCGNNLAELYALRLAAKHIVVNRGSDITIHTTSEYILHGLYSMKSWKDRGWIKANGKPVAHADIWAEIEVHLHGNDFVAVREQEDSEERMKLLQKAQEKTGV